MAARSVVILGAARTPIGRGDGLLKDIPAIDLGAVAAKSALDRAKVPTDEVDEVIFGHACSASHDRNVARAISRLVGMSPSIPAYTIDKADASALQAIVSGAQSILLGESDCVLAGGVEALDTIRVARENGSTDADTFAERFAITREQIERFARESQQRAESARQAGHFAREIAAVEIREPARTIDADDPARTPSLTPAAGAAAVVLASDQWALDRGLTALAQIGGWASAGLDPTRGSGAVPAVAKLKERYGFDLSEFDVVELVDLPIAQTLAALQELAIPTDKLNVNGGVSVLGHPIAATGARVVVSMLYELERRGGKTGLVVVPVGDGMGMAMAVERL